MPTKSTRKPPDDQSPNRQSPKVVSEAAQQSARRLGRNLIPDPTSPGVPAHDGLPAVPQGYREVTQLEYWLWQVRSAHVLSGGVWSDAVRDEMIRFHENYQATHQAKAA